MDQATVTQAAGVGRQGGRGAAAYLHGPCPCPCPCVLQALYRPLTLTWWYTRHSCDCDCLQPGGGPRSPGCGDYMEIMTTGAGLGPVVACGGCRMPNRCLWTGRDGWAGLASRFQIRDCDAMRSPDVTGVGRRGDTVPRSRRFATSHRIPPDLVGLPRRSSHLDGPNHLQPITSSIPRTAHQHQPNPTHQTTIRRNRDRPFIGLSDPSRPGTTLISALQAKKAIDAGSRGHRLPISNPPGPRHSLFLGCAIGGAYPLSSGRRGSFTLS